LRLLRSIAEFPRKALTDRFFFRGLQVNEEELIKAMDVCNDALVKRWAQRECSWRELEQRARSELQLIHQIMEDQADPRSKCGALLALIEGHEKERVLKKLEELRSKD